MNHQATSKEKLLTAARILVAEEGFSALAIRNLAEAASVSVGTVYNYFPSKKILMAEVVESVWLHIFHGDNWTQLDNFLSSVEWIYGRLMAAQRQYPDIMQVHFHGLPESDSEKMQAIYQHIEAALVTLLDQDEDVRQNVFGADLTSQQLARFALHYLMYQAALKKDNCADLLAVLKALLYEEDMGCLKKLSR